MKLVIFGCGRIANRIARSCKMVEGLGLVGFASKDPQKAKEYCETYNCEKYGDYDHFLDSDVDAVYIATYNRSHYELIRRCLEHGKNVICEKPMLFSIKDNHELFELARKNDVLLMEALKSVFLPINIKIRQMVKDKVIGDVEEIYAAFMRNGSHGEDHHQRQEKGSKLLHDGIPSFQRIELHGKAYTISSLLSRVIRYNSFKKVTFSLNKPFTSSSRRLFRPILLSQTGNLLPHRCGAEYPRQATARRGWHSPGSG